MALIFSTQYTRNLITIPKRPLQPVAPSLGEDYATFTSPASAAAADIIIFGLIPAGWEVVDLLLRHEADIAATALVDVGCHALVTADVYPTLSTDTALVTATGGDIDCFISAYDADAGKCVRFPNAITSELDGGFAAQTTVRLLTLAYTTMTTPAAKTGSIWWKMIKVL